MCLNLAIDCRNHLVETACAMSRRFSKEHIRRRPALFRSSQESRTVYDKVGKRHTVVASVRLLDLYVYVPTTRNEQTLEKLPALRNLLTYNNSRSRSM